MLKEDNEKMKRDLDGDKMLIITGERRTVGPDILKKYIKIKEEKKVQGRSSCKKVEQNENGCSWCRRTEESLESARTET